MENGHDEGCSGRNETCEKLSEGKRNHCYVLWTEDENGKINVKLKVSHFEQTLYLLTSFFFEGLFFEQFRLL